MSVPLLTYIGSNLTIKTAMDGLCSTSSTTGKFHPWTGSQETGAGDCCPVPVQNMPSDGIGPPMAADRAPCRGRETGR